MERARTQQGAAELRAAFKEAMQDYEETAEWQLAALRHRNEEALARQCSKEALVVCALRDEALKARTTLEAVTVELKAEEQTAHQAQENQKVAQDAANAAEAEVHCVEVVCATLATEALTAAEARDAGVLEAQEAFHECREAQVAEVVARFEHEHFRLSAQLAAEVDRRLTAEHALDDFRCRASSSQELTEVCDDSTVPALPQSVDIGIQVGHCGGEDGNGLCLPSPRHERLEFQLADLEARLWLAERAETGCLQIVEDRFRHVVALKNDVIDALKDELWRREREILETHAIISGHGGRPAIDC